MTSPLPIPVAKLETRLRLAAGTLTGPDADAAAQYIADATALALAEVPVATQATWQTACPDVVVLVILKAARREFENPSGLSQEISGEHTITTAATTGVFLTPLEISQVRRAAGLSRGGAVGSVTLCRTREWDEP
jgi:hypothetical protein